MAEEKISVRNLVEFILRQGDLDNREGSTDVDAMQKGSQLHKKIQKGKDSTYRPEVSLKMEIPLEYGDDVIILKLEGRADGIQTLPSLDGCKRALIDEIKTVKKDLGKMEAPDPVHVAQAKCYAYMYGEEEGISSGIVRLTYCHQETEEIRYFEEPYELSELKEWFYALIKEYSKWVFWKRDWVKKRNESIKKVEFPFEYRPGQKELAVGVYRTILRKKKLYLEAPTGVGKTLSTVFPAVKAMGEEICEKIFYLTAKTIARSVASDTFSLLNGQGLLMKVLTITAKEKICILDKPDCNPAACIRAKGHFDRINDAVFALLTSDELLIRETIERYSEKYQVCPFELSLDVAVWCDAIICDYNYVFDPNVALKRFFDGGANNYVFLIDEAHNLVERAREMYSASLVKEQFLKVRQIVKGSWKRVEKRLGACNNILLKYKRECDDMLVVEDVHELAVQLLRLSQAYDELMEAKPDYGAEEMNEILTLYFDLKRFLSIYELLDDKYEILFQFLENGAFQVKLQCMDPSENLKKYLSKGRSAIFFSATLLPVSYYRQQLAGEPEDYAIYAPSPFPKENRRVFLAKGVSTVYKRRTREEYRRILSYIRAFVAGKKGNYLVFFPSYRMMEDVLAILEEPEFQPFYEIAEIYEQKAGMTEREKEEFLSLFSEDEKANRSKVGMCVLGGVFGEGIDLTGDRLIGAVVVGTGLPMVGPARELFRSYYDEKKQMGFEYAYLYPGMNKVMQAAGRVIRTMEDRGVVLLLDERFQYSQYQKLFPREWFPWESVSLEEMKEKLKAFWNE